MMASNQEDNFNKDVYETFLTVLTNDRNQLEKNLRYWSEDYARSIFTEEVRLLTLKDSLLKGSEIVIKLQTCNIESLTSTHLAAYKGKYVNTIDFLFNTVNYSHIRFKPI